MAVPTDPDTWINFVQAGYHDDAPGDACGFCNRGENVETRTSGEQDTGTPARNTRRLQPRSPTLLQASRTGKEPHTGKETQKARKECRRFFCVPCKQGSLCEKEFQAEGRPHFQHALLQVFKTTYNCTVRKADVGRFLDTSVVMQYFSNDHVVHHVSTRKLGKATPIYCHGCKKFVANAKSSPWKERNLDSAKVCSIECLLLYLHPTENFRNGHYRKQMEPMRSPLV